MNALRAIVAGCVLGLCISTVLAGDKSAEVNTEYLLSSKAGPFLIYMASFHGDEARDMAWKLTHELRTEYRLPAYMFSRSDQRRREEQKKRDELREKYQGAPVRVHRVIDEYAVFVGGYRDEDSARRALERIRKQRAPDSIPLSNIFSVKPKASKRGPGGRLLAQEAALNPFTKAWVVRNPLLPREMKKEEPPFDPFLVRLNKNEPNSLLECSQPWTLQVKAFHGATVIQTKKATDNDSLFGGMKPGESLVTAALNARKLADALQSKELGLRPYIFHTRQSSIVTVGGFRNPKDPELQRVQRLLASHGFKDTVPMPVPRP